MKKSVLLGGLAASHLAVFGIGWAIAPDQAIDEEVQQTGFMKVQATKVLEATVESLRAENKLLVYSYKGSAKVSASRTVYKFFSGRQELQIPAVVNYYVDLSEMTFANVAFEEKAKIVRVRIPMRLCSCLARTGRWATACKAAGLPGLHIHDLRHAAIGALVNSGVSLHVAGKVAGHLRPESTARYAHIADTTLAAAVEAGAATMGL